jgi:hypothetical protein
MTVSTFSIGSPDLSTKISVAQEGGWHHFSSVSGEEWRAFEALARKICVRCVNPG